MKARCILVTGPESYGIDPRTGDESAAYTVQRANNEGEPIGEWYRTRSTRGSAVNLAHRIAQREGLELIDDTYY